MRKFLMGAVSAATIALTAGAAAADPAIWKVSDDDSEIWLFGSVHLLQEGTEWRTETLETALSEADYFYYETPTDAEAQQTMQGLIQEYGLNGQGEALNDALNEEQVALLNEVAPTIGLNPAQLQPMKPWLANISIGIMAIQKAGYNPESGVEMALGAETPDDKERFFETAEEQIRFLASGDAELQADALESTLKQLKNDPDMFDRMVAAWAEGDADALDEIIVEAMKDVDPMVYETLILKRNENWVEDIRTLMEGEEDALITVGAGHLVGENGVPALLEAAGYTVERVQ